MTTNGDEILKQVCRRLRNNDAQTRTKYTLHMERGVPLE